jgi:DNA-binding NarL/FixJ family response regulator
MRAPLVVVEGVDAAYEGARAELESEGWRIAFGWGARGYRVVCCGPVATDEDAAAAVLAAVEGSGVLALARARRELIDRLLDDLRRLGAVEHRTADRAVGPPLDQTQRRLLELLAEGLPLGTAAQTLHISRRTADRRLAAIRAAYGVTTTAEALISARRLPPTPV